MYKKLAGKDGFIYDLVFGVEIEGDGSQALDSGKDKFYMITGKAATGSILPLDVGYIFRDSVGLIPIAGDKVKPVSMEKMNFVRDGDDSFSKNNEDNTVQTDTAKSYAASRFAEISGNLAAGQFVVGSETQKKYLNIFVEIVEDDGAGNVTLKPVSAETLWIASRFNESIITDEEEITFFKPILLNSLSLSKPLDGKQEFSMSYNVQGELKPLFYYGKVPA